jgi:hypothetical protein
MVLSASCDFEVLKNKTAAKRKYIFFILQVGVIANV